MKANLLLLKYLIRDLKNKILKFMTSVSKNVHIGTLADIASKYVYHIYS